MGWFFKKKKDSFDDKARELAAERRLANSALETRRKELELERLEMRHDLEMAKLKSEIAEYQDDDEFDLDSQFQSFMVNSLKNKLPQAAPQQVQSSPLAPQPVGVSFTDDQIKNIIHNMNPLQKIMAKRSSDDTIAGYIREKVPDIDDDSINRAIFIIREDL